MKFLRKNTPTVPARRRASDADGSLVRTRATEGELAERYSFRRNRTMTGSLSSRVASANEHAALLKSPRVQVHELHAHRRQLLGMLAGLLAAMLLLIGLMLHLIARVTVVPSSEIAHLVDVSMYERSINAYLNQHPMQRFRFSVDTEGLADYLQKNGYPEVSRVSEKVSFEGIGAARFVIEFRQAAVSWKASGSELYVDTLGSAFSRNYYAAPPVGVIDMTGVQATGNQVLTSNRFLGFVGRIVGGMKGYGYTVTDVIIPANTTRQVQVKLEGYSYPITFSIDRPAGVQTEDAANAVRYVSSRKITPQYLDVRVSGKAYYK